MATFDENIAITLVADQLQDSRPAAAHDSTPHSAQNRWRLVLARADNFELPLVRRLAATTRFRWVRSAAIAINFLGNGWIYVPIAVGLLLSQTANAGAIAICALLATAIAHGLYAIIKYCIVRPRPFDRDSNLRSLCKVMDRNSFPSGHCMTLTAVMLPILISEPNYWPTTVLALALLAWSRLVAAHHYLSDIVGGIVLGAVVALPVAAWRLPL